MKKTGWITILLIVLCGCKSSLKENNSLSDDVAIAEALSEFKSSFPKGQLRDVYKSFYQDAFGPGHLLVDTTSARNYLRYELSDTSRWGGPLIEPTGIGKNFYRVNMSLIRDSIVPEDVYFSAFVNSLGEVEKPDSAQWVEEWSKVDSIISVKNINFPNETEDRELIEDKIRTGNFTMHHSDRFNSDYNYHYRIIAIPVYETQLKHLLPSNHN